MVTHDREVVVEFLASKFGIVVPRTGLEAIADVLLAPDQDALVKAFAASKVAEVQAEASRLQAQAAARTAVATKLDAASKS